MSVRGKSIGIDRPSKEDGLRLVRAGDVSGLFAADGMCSYAFVGVKPDGRIDVMVTAATGRVRRQSYTLADIEFRFEQVGWEFESELDAYLKRERYVRLDPDTCALLALQLVHKCMRNPLEAFHDRISDEEMKGLNKSALNRVFTVLAHLFDLGFRTSFERLAAPDNWDPPELADDLDPWKGSWGGRRPDVTLKAPWPGARPR